MCDQQIIILAAGESKRMGEPKQLLVYEKATLLERAYQTAWSVCTGCVRIVLGANAANILEEIPVIKDISVYNAKWKQGMGASINYGLQSVLNAFPSTKAVMFMTVDQPFITAEHLRALLTTHEGSTAAIVASGYGNTSGIPAIFGSQYFPELLALTGEKGAKDLLAKHAAKLTSVPFADAATDVDTPAQFASLSSAKQQR